MKRYSHNLSNYRLVSGDMGELIPVCWYEALPGDSWRQRTSALVRMSPMLAPVMHPVTIRFHHWFVPNRLIWADWEKFITGGSDGMDTTVHPFISSGGGGFAAGALADYLGVPPGVANLEVNALPFRAYGLIFNEHYRDQDLVTARALSTGNGADATTAVTLSNCAWEKDTFTTCRPWTQKGPSVTLPLGTSAPVRINPASGAIATPGRFKLRASGNLPADDTAVDQALGVVQRGGTNDELVYDPNGTLIADLSGATAVDVNAVRRAFALQRYEEARAQYGSRYPEYLEYLGVRSSDARLQRPEYLGGGKQTFSFSEVLQTGTNFDANGGVATLRGHGISALRTRRYMRFFEEHGIVMTLMSVRPKTVYANGLARKFSRSTKEDYWQKELELIGQQAHYNKETYAAHGTPNGIFGYNDRYAEYRHEQSSVSGEFRTSTLNMWHLGRIFAADTTLNSSFVQCDPSKRINAVQTNDVLWVMVNNQISGRRMVRKSSVGRIM